MEVMKNQPDISRILFMDDDSYINRGNLKFDSYSLYYHSWINFKYENLLVQR